MLELVLLVGVLTGAHDRLGDGVERLDGVVVRTRRATDDERLARAVGRPEAERGVAGAAAVHRVDVRRLAIGAGVDLAQVLLELFKVKERLRDHDEHAARNGLVHALARHDVLNVRNDGNGPTVGGHGRGHAQHIVGDLAKGRPRGQVLTIVRCGREAQLDSLGLGTRALSVVTGTHVGCLPCLYLAYSVRIGGWFSA